MNQRFSVQLKMERIRAVLERSEKISNVRVAYRLPRIIRDQVLLRDICDVVALVVFSQKVIERLFFSGTILFRDRLIPFFSVRKLGIDVKYHPAKRVLLVSDNLSEMIFGARFDHTVFAPYRSRRLQYGLSNPQQHFAGNNV